MRYTLITALLLFIVTSAFAQQEKNQGYIHDHGACGTLFNGPKLEAWLKDFQARSAHDKKQYSRNVGYDLPLKIHIVGKDDGSGYYELEELFNAICVLNEDYSPTGLQFFIQGEINYINDSTYWYHDYAGGRAMMNGNNVKGAINVYFVKQAVEGNCGYFSPQADALAISESCQKGDATTLTHELGHFLSLPHTFYGWESRTFDENPLRASLQERQDGSNCSWAGDGFCDTPPDYHSSRWSCPYNFGYTDPVGTQIETDGEFYMSYSNDACQTKFSEEQIDAMYANINEMRSELIQSESNPEVDLASLELVTPANYTYDLPLNYIPFAWEPLENAVGYHIQISKNSRFSNLVVDQIVYDNYYISQNELIFDKGYYWRVKPLGKYNTCSGYSEEREFSAGAESSDIDSTSWNVWENTGLEDILLKDLNVYPNPVAQGQRIFLDVSRILGESGTLLIKDLTGRSIYTETLVANKAIYSVNNLTLNKGIYVIEILNDNKRFSSKVAVQ